MLVGLSKPELIFVRVTAVLLIYPGLICFAYFVLAALAGGVPAIAHPFSIFIEVYGAIEILWYLFWFLPFKHRLQRRGSAPQRMTREERKELFTKGMDTVPDLENYVRGWFDKAHIEDIRRDNLKDWLLWSLFGRDGNCGEDAPELEEYIKELEERMGVTFKKGRGDAKALRLSFDSIKMTHRSLLFYTVCRRRGAVQAFEETLPADFTIAHWLRRHSDDSISSVQRLQVLPPTAKYVLQRLPLPTYDLILSSAICCPRDVLLLPPAHFEKTTAYCVYSWRWYRQ